MAGFTQNLTTIMINDSVNKFSDMSVPSHRFMDILVLGCSVKGASPDRYRWCSNPNVLYNY